MWMAAWRRSNEVFLRSADRVSLQDDDLLHAQLATISNGLLGEVWVHADWFSHRYLNIQRLTVVFVDFFKRDGFYQVRNHGFTRKNSEWWEERRKSQIDPPYVASLQGPASDGWGRLQNASIPNNFHAVALVVQRYPRRNSINLNSEINHYVWE